MVLKNTLLKQACKKEQVLGISVSNDSLKWSAGSLKQNGRQEASASLQAHARRPSYLRFPALTAIGPDIQPSCGRQYRVQRSIAVRSSYQEDKQPLKKPDDSTTTGRFPRPRFISAPQQAPSARSTGKSPSGRLSKNRRQGHPHLTTTSSPQGPSSSPSSLHPLAHFLAHLEDAKSESQLLHAIQNCPLLGESATTLGFGLKKAISSEKHFQPQDLIAAFISILDAAVRVHQINAAQTFREKALGYKDASAAAPSSGPVPNCGRSSSPSHSVAHLTASWAVHSLVPNLGTMSLPQIRSVLRSLTEVQFQDTEVWSALHQAVLAAVHQGADAGTLDARQVAQVLWEASHSAFCYIRRPFNSEEEVAAQSIMDSSASPALSSSEGGPATSGLVSSKPTATGREGDYADTSSWVHDMVQQILILKARDGRSGAVMSMMTGGPSGEPLGGEVLSQVMATYAAWRTLPAAAWMEVLEEELQMGVFLMTPGQCGAILTALSEMINLVEVGSSSGAASAAEELEMMQDGHGVQQVVMQGGDASSSSSSRDTAISEWSPALLLRARELLLLLLAEAEGKIGSTRLTPPRPSGAMKASRKVCQQPRRNAKVKVNMIRGERLPLDRDDRTRVLGPVVEAIQQAMEETRGLLLRRTAWNVLPGPSSPVLPQNETQAGGSPRKVSLPAALTAANTQLNASTGYQGPSRSPNDDPQVSAMRRQATGSHINPWLELCFRMLLEALPVEAGLHDVALVSEAVMREQYTMASQVWREAFGKRCMDIMLRSAPTTNNQQPTSSQLTTPAAIVKEAVEQKQELGGRPLPAPVADLGVSAVSSSRSSVTASGTAATIVQHTSGNFLQTGGIIHQSLQSVLDLHVVIKSLSFMGIVPLTEKDWVAGAEQLLYRAVVPTGMMSKGSRELQDHEGGDSAEGAAGLAGDAVIGGGGGEMWLVAIKVCLSLDNNALQLNSGNYLAAVTDSCSAVSAYHQDSECPSCCSACLERLLLRLRSEVPSWDCQQLQEAALGLGSCLEAVMCSKLSSAAELAAAQLGRDLLLPALAEEALIRLEQAAPAACDVAARDQQSLAAGKAAPAAAAAVVDVAVLNSGSTSASGLRSGDKIPSEKGAKGVQQQKYSRVGRQQPSARPFELQDVGKGVDSRSNKTPQALSASCLTAAAAALSWSFPIQDPDLSSQSMRRSGGLVISAQLSDAPPHRSQVRSKDPCLNPASSNGGLDPLMDSCDGRWLSVWTRFWRLSMPHLKHLTIPQLAVVAAAAAAVHPPADVAAVHAQWLHRLVSAVNGSVVIHEMSADLQVSSDREPSAEVVDSGDDEDTVTINPTAARRSLQLSTPMQLALVRLGHAMVAMLGTDRRARMQRDVISSRLKLLRCRHSFWRRGGVNSDKSILTRRPLCMSVQFYHSVVRAVAASIQQAGSEVHHNVP
ncbi:hypothetical protein CEUSTIGMA_g13408.t1, partial [Chlamydomonas eustigma]